MDDFWGVIWGASIALVASIVGGALTSLAGPALARKADARERLRVSEAERREVVRDAIQHACEAMRRGAMDWDADAIASRERLVDKINMIAITLRLRTTEEEEAVERTLFLAATSKTQEDLVIESIAWERTAAAWFRGVVSNSDFEKALDAESKRVSQSSEAIRASYLKTDPEQESETGGELP